MIIEIPGKPIPQARHRLWRRFVYDPSSSSKKQIRKFLTPLSKKFKHPHISFLFQMPVPKSVSAKVKRIYNENIHRHEKKPDTDNLIKLYLDCMTGLFYEDDNIVSIGQAVKIYSEEPKTIIKIEEWTVNDLAVLSSEFGKCSLFEKDDYSDFCNPLTPYPLRSPEEIAADNEVSSYNLLRAARIPKVSIPLTYA